MAGAAPACRRAGPAPAASSAVERLDPRFDALVPPGAALEVVSGGHDWVEGPLWLPDSSVLLFTDIPRNVVYQWRPGEDARVFLERAGYSGTAPFSGREPGANGLALDPHGRLVLAEHGDRRITRLEPDGRRTVLADRYEGKRLNSPNDVAFRSNGDLYFTDPPFGLPGTFDDPARELAWSGVYRLSPDGALTLLLDDLTHPNGLAFSPDERTLYVSNADRARAVILAYPVRDDGTLGEGRVFADLTPLAARLPGGPDGIEVDAAGNVFAVGPGGVYVFAPDGAHLGTIVTGVATSNVAWGGDGSDLYVTAGTAVHRIRLTTRGPVGGPGRRRDQIAEAGSSVNY
jgi:gluconolactonase